MTGPMLRDRRAQVALLLAFVLGLLVGWWVLGWWLAPVSYTNALPQDLRADAKDEYLMMTADAYAVSGNMDVVRRRVTDYGWPPDQLARDLGALQTRMSRENPAAAQNVQRLSAALGVNAGAGQPATTGGDGGAAAENPSLISRLCPGALWVILLLLGLAAIAWLWQRWRSTQAALPGAQPAARGTFDRSPSGRMTGDQPGSLASSPPTRDADLAGPGGASTAPLFGGRESGSTVVYGEPYGAGPYNEDQEDAEDADVEGNGLAGSAGLRPSQSAPPFLAGGAAADRAATGPSQASAPLPAQPSTASAAPGRLVKISEFSATYHAGEPDYDEAFDIKDARGAVVGQCGLSLMMPVGRGNDQAAALQVWLWEERDQYTQVKVLMSEGAYRDTGLRSQLAEENPALQVRPGAEFDMDSHTLRLHGIIEKATYVDQEPYHQMFELLIVRLQVFQKDR